MNTNIKTSEEFKGIVTVYLNNGHTINIPTQTLIDYVESEKLNVTDTYGGNSGSGEPWLDNETVECTEPVEEYFDREFDSVVEMYYNNVILK